MGFWLEGVNADNITRVRIEAGPEAANVVTVERSGKDADWRVPQTFDYAADQSKVDQTIRDLSGLEIADVVSSTDHHHVDLKVADNKYEKKVVLESEDSKTALYFGTSGRGGSVHVRRGDQDTVYAVRDYSSWRLSTQPDSWIDKKYFDVDRSRVVAVSLRNKHGNLKLERHGRDVWKLSDGKMLVDADTSEVDTFLGKIDGINMTKLAGKREDSGFAADNADVELVVGLGTIPALPATEGGSDDAQGESSAHLADVASGPLAIEDSYTLRLKAKGDDSDPYLMLKEGSDYVAQVSKWSVSGLLDAQQDEFVAKPEAGAVE